MRVQVTDDRGAWSGEWFEAAVEGRVLCYGPMPNRGAALQLWLTKTGRWVLRNLRGTDRSTGTPTAEVVEPERAAAILDGWGHPLPPDLKPGFAGKEI